ncbi:metal ABC transporter permease [Tepidibacillus fermentans]|uniref:Zinc transport system permease protein n=1 Tax=Tepidibacillus fermentans TaxID=1281767 RepID=A0A4R3KHX5_9BACI|nr:metal ABC transporter permease [Tepidibacillus fermentans]TCS83103.1 zinc transport system permease protein [Tepidibacillus fermentans]
MFDMLQYDFMQRALLAGIMIAVISPTIGVFIVLRRLSLIGDTLSHVTLAGVAAGILAGIYPVLSGMIFAVLAALGIEKLRKLYRSYEELAIPIMLSAGIGIAVVLISLANGFNVDLFSYLFGSVMAVSKQDLWTILIVGIVIILLVYLFFKELFYLSFDEEAARLSGIPHRFINTLFIVLVALTISLSMRIVGILLVSSLMTIPVAASLQIANSFRKAYFYSILFSLLSVILGIVFSYLFDLATGGTIVLTSIAILLVVIIGKRIFVGKHA